MRLDTLFSAGLDSCPNRATMSGPASYVNWRRKIDNVEPRGGYETAVFTDARILGMEPEGYGPYQFLNTITVDDTLGVARPAIVLRVDLFGKVTLSDLGGTDERGYHAGWLDDELAAVLSLCLGIRAAAGDQTREFGPNDERGLPCGIRWRPNPVLAPFRGASVVPSVVGQHNLELVAPFKGFFQLSPDAAEAVIRAARLYQQGLWIAESDQNIAWIMLSSAVETAANYWRRVEDAPADRLRAWKPDLADRIAAASEELLTEVAAVVAPLAGATKKFLDFLLTFCPPPPERRPPEWFQLNWSRTGLRAAFNKVYSYRSRALHAGIPFPSPMGWAPMPFGESFAEKGAGAAGTGVHSWSAEDLPILLHTFEYIVRHSLLSWWKSLPRMPVPS